MKDLDLDLAAAAREYDVPAGDVDVIVHRAARRSRRRQRVLGATAAVAAVGASLAFVNLASDDDEPSVTAIGAPSAQTGDAGISWTAVEPTSRLSMLRIDPTVQVGDRLYALSTAPGEVDPNAEWVPSPLQVWTSADGVDWSAGPAPTDDIYLSDLDGDGGERIYAVGTGQATAAVVNGSRIPEVRVGWSDDGAESWTTEALPIDFATIAEHATAIGVTSRSVAVAPSGVVAVTGLSAELDVPEVLPDGDTAPDGWAITRSGVDVLGPPADDVCEATRPTSASTRADEQQTGSQRIHPTYCGDRNGASVMVTPQDSRGVVRSYTWDELGVEGDLRAAVLGQPFAFASAGGSTFERVELPEVPMLGTWATLEAGDDGFDLVLTSYEPDASIAYLRSADGHAWSVSPTPPSGLSWVTASGTVAGRNILVGSETATGRAIVLTGQGGAGWQSTDLVTLIDPDVVDGRDAYLFGGGVGPLGIAVVVGLSDERSDRSEAVLLVSRDGRTWEVQRLDDLAGTTVGTIGRVLVTDDRMVVTVGRATRTDANVLDQIVLIGTPS